MTWAPSIPIRTRLRRFATDEDGTTLIELGMIISLFLLLLFILLDFGRMGSEYVLAEKALQRAARIATVRPPVCASVPQYHVVPAGTASPATVGTLCRAGTGTCATVSLSCTGDLTNETFQEIWWGSDLVAGGVAGIRDILPRNATPQSIVFRYDTDPNLGFLGGPFTPIVTVEINPNPNDRLTFQSVFPLGGLAGLSGASGAPATFDNRSIPFPLLSVSLPGEDLSHRPPDS